METAMITGLEECGLELIDEESLYNTEWSLHNGEVSIVVKRRVALRLKYVRLQYFTILCHGDTFTNEDTIPDLTPTQVDQLDSIKLELKQLWDKERDLLNTLLKLWDNTSALTQVRYGVKFHNRTVYELQYDHYLNHSIGYRIFTVRLHIEITYILNVSTGEVELECCGTLSLGLGLNHQYSRTEEESYQFNKACFGWELNPDPITLSTFSLPVVDGMVDRTQLVEYFSNNPLLGLGTDMQAFGKGLVNT